MFEPLSTFTRTGPPMPWRSVAITVAAIVIPPLVGVLIYGRMGAVAFIASMSAHLAAKDDGVLTATMVTLVLGLAGLLALGDPTMALLIAPVLGIMTGICGLHGLARPCLRALITWTVFTSPILPADEKPLLFGIFILGMAWALILTAVFKETRTTEEEATESNEYALVFGIVLAAGLALSVYVGGQYFGSHGFWFPLTFVVLVIPPHGTLFSRTMKRTVGTVLGTLLAVAAAWVSDATWLVLTLGGVSLVLAFRALPWNYTIFTALLTVAVLELLALVSDVGTLAVERLGTMAAAAVMTLALGALGFVGLKLLRPEALESLQDE